MWAARSSSLHEGTSLPKTPSAVASSSSSSSVPPQVSAASTTSSYALNGGIPPDVADKIRATRCGALLVNSVSVRRFNASPNANMEYYVTLTAAGRSVTTAPVKAELDFVSGWTLSFRDVYAVFPIDATYDGRQGVVVSLQSECQTLQFGSATCRVPREWSALSRPRGEVLVVFHEVHPTSTGSGGLPAALVQSGGDHPHRGGNAWSSSTAGGAWQQQQAPFSAVRGGGGGGGSATGMRMAPLAVRPSTANVLGRAPLQAPRPGFSGSSAYNYLAALPGSAGTIDSTGGGRQSNSNNFSANGTVPFGQSPPSPRHQQQPHSTYPSGALSTAGSPGPPPAAALPRTVVLSDWVLDDIPPAVQSSNRTHVFLVVKFAHVEHRLEPAPARAPKGPSDDPEADEDEHSRAGGKRRYESGAAEDDENGERVTHRRLQRRTASWPHASLSFDVPLILTEPVATIAAYWADMANPSGGTVFAEASVTIDTSASQTSGQKIAKRVTFTGLERCVVMFTAQTVVHEARREGASGRPTSAFPRRVPPHTATTTTTTTTTTGTSQANPPSASAASSSSPGFQTVSRSLPAAPLSSAAPNSESGISSKAGATTTASLRPASAGPRRLHPATPMSGNGSTIVRGFDQRSGLAEEELPDDDFVVRDEDADDDDDELDAVFNTVSAGSTSGGVAARTAAAATNTKVLSSVSTQQATRSRGGGHGGSYPHSTPPSSKSVLSYASLMDAAAVDAFVAQFQAVLAQSICNGFDSVEKKVEEVHQRIQSLEEKVNAMAAAAASGPAGVLSSSVGPSSFAAASSAGGASVGGDGNAYFRDGDRSSGVGTPPPMSYSSSSGHAPHAYASAGSQPLRSTTSSRPNSGDSYCGPQGVAGQFPEHANPLYTDGQLRHTFRRYDAEGTGFITKAQLIHFYRTHNSFAVDETNEDLEISLRSFVPGLDSDLVSFDEFSLVALRLAKI